MKDKNENSTSIESILSKLKRDPFNLIINSINELKSAQHKVLKIQIQYNEKASILSKNLIESGNFNIILRIWNGRSRFWNLNCASYFSDTDCENIIAQVEVAGYQNAHEIFCSNEEIIIPQVLHHEQNWAIFTYVGKESTYFHDLPFDTKFTESMIKLRFEFLFDEPHPRHGRIAHEYCLDYAFQLIEKVILPLHAAASYHQYEDLRVLCCHYSCLPKYLMGKAFTFETMIYIQDFVVSNLRKKAFQKENFKAYIEKASNVHQILKQSISSIPRLSPTLVHMDLQPQNLLFSSSSTKSVPTIRCILDWEEAAYADPRFELLLLGRKVCCSMDHLNDIWTFYEKKSNSTLGPLEPWCQLETLHSILTSLLQALESDLSTGRNSWEQLQDLESKIDREFQRLLLFWNLEF